MAGTMMRDACEPCLGKLVGMGKKPETENIAARFPNEGTQMAWITLNRLVE
jgi:hypothetical protein